MAVENIGSEKLFGLAPAAVQVPRPSEFPRPRRLAFGPVPRVPGRQILKPPAWSRSEVLRRRNAPEVSFGAAVRGGVQRLLPALEQRRTVVGRPQRGGQSRPMLFADPGVDDVVTPGSRWLRMN
jgi:hypothetical protein